MNKDAVKDLLFRIADDQLIIGHRNSEWTGIGPMLEEDIAFSSMAQDKLGQSLQFYQLLQEMGEEYPDTLAFTRNADQFRNCTFVELPVENYSFSLIRHFLFDHAELIRFETLSDSTVEPLAQLSRKIKGEIQYHVMHARAFIEKLGNATEDSVAKLQQSMTDAFPYALGIFEPSEFERELSDKGIAPPESELQEKWVSTIRRTIKKTKILLPDPSKIKPRYGGRYGNHTDYLEPLLDEMSEVYRSDPTTNW